MTDGNTEKGCQKQQKTTTTTDDDDDEVCVPARRRQNEVIDPNLMIKVGDVHHCSGLSSPK